MSPSSPDSAQIPAAAAAGLDAAKLEEAFRLFNQVSDELSLAYTRLQAQAAQLTERMHLLQDALPAGVVVVGGDGLIVQVNPAAERMLGPSLAGVRWSGVEADRLRAADLPGEYLVADGRRLSLIDSALDSEGGRIVLLHDVTEAHRLKAQAGRNERLAAMGEMAAQVAHQLRTPLAAALLYAGNLENPDLPAATRTSIAQKTVARLKALEHLIQDMLLFARGEAQGREIIAAPDLVQEVAQIIEPLAKAAGVAFQVADNSGGISFNGNRKELAGALANLLENALHAAGKGGRVALEARRAHHTLVLAVRDNGSGMAADVVARLFEPFFTTRAEGTGLGLAIARGVARAHGGNIEVNSAPGAGTEFLFSIAGLVAGDGERKET